MKSVKSQELKCYDHRFCTLYRAIQGDSPSQQGPIAERREEIGPIPGPR